MQRRRILDSARAEFAGVGYDATTVAGIAKHARVGRAVVYETVGDKEAILAAVTDEVAGELVAAIDWRFGAAEAVARPIADLIRDDLTWFMHHIRADPSIAAIVRMSGRLSRGGDDPVSLARRRIEDRLTQLHEDRAREYGLERGASARLVAVIVLSLAEGVAFRAAAEEAWPTEQTAALIAEFATGGYLRIEGAEHRHITEDFDRLAAEAEGSAAGTAGVSDRSNPD